MASKKEEIKPLSKKRRKRPLETRMWVKISLDEKGLKYRSSQQEEGLALIALALSTTEDGWNAVKDFVEERRLKRKQRLN
jgi:hypothetical protein